MLCTTIQNFETKKQAKDFSALLALLHLQPLHSLERKLPEPYRTTWLGMVVADKIYQNSMILKFRGFRI